MPADQTEVVCQYMAIQLFAELSAYSAATDTTNQSTEDGARDCTDGDAKRSGKGADRGAYLASCECRAHTSSSTANGTHSGTYRHGCSEGGNFFGVTARTLK
jgi:hypothetical protein